MSSPPKPWENGAAGGDPSAAAAAASSGIDLSGAPMTSMPTSAAATTTAAGQMYGPQAASTLPGMSTAYGGGMNSPYGMANNSPYGGTMGSAYGGMSSYGASPYGGGYGSSMYGGAGGYGSSMYGGGGYGSSMYGGGGYGSSMYGGGGYGSSMYGGGMYGGGGGMYGSRYGMMGGGGMMGPEMGMLGGLSQTIGSMGQVSEMLGSNAEALHFSFNAFGMFLDRIGALAHDAMVFIAGVPPPVVLDPKTGQVLPLMDPRTGQVIINPQTGQPMFPPTAEEHKVMRRKKMINWVLGLFVLYLGYRLIKRMFSQGKTALTTASMDAAFNQASAMRNMGGGMMPNNNQFGMNQQQHAFDFEGRGF